MINRIFDDLKFFRSFLGGSKKEEKKIFNEFNSVENLENLDWFNYRITMIKYFDDLLNMIYSWRFLFEKIQYVFAAIALVEFVINPILAGVTLGLSIITHIIFKIMCYKQKNKLKEYDFVLSIINNEILNRHGLNLTKNF